MGATITLTHDQFTYSNRLFEANTASLNLVASSSYPSNINLVGRTGAVVQFQYDRTVTGVGGIVSWNYVPTTAAIAKVPDVKGLRIRIFNV